MKLLNEKIWELVAKPNIEMCSDSGNAFSSYLAFFEKVENLYEEDDADNKENIAQTTIYMAVELLAFVTIKDLKVIMPDCSDVRCLIYYNNTLPPFKDDTSKNYYLDFYKRFLIALSDHLDNIMRNEPWGITKNEFDFFALQEKILRIAVILVYLKYGGYCKKIDECYLYHKDKNEYEVCAYPLTNELFDLINITSQDDFLNESREYCSYLNSNNTNNFYYCENEMPLCNYGLIMTDNSKAVELLLSSNKTYMNNFLECVTPDNDQDTIIRKISTILKVIQRKNLPPVNVVQLQKDAETLDESVQCRIKVLSDWVKVQTEMFNYRYLTEEEESELEDLRIEVGELKSKLTSMHELNKSINTSFNELGEEMQKAIDESTEEKQKRRNAEIERDNLQTELDRTKQALENAQTQMAISSNGTEREKELEKLLEKERTDRQKEQGDFDERLKKLSEEIESDLCNRLFIDVKKRHKRTDKYKNEWLESIVSSFTDFPKLIELIDNYRDELDRKEEERVAKEESRADRSVTALEKQADKKGGLSVDNAENCTIIDTQINK